MKRVFVLSRNTLFGQGIETLLSMEDELDIVSRYNDIRSAVESIQSTCPEVVILNCDDPEPEISPALLCILREKPGICVIGVSLQDNSICVYRGERKRVSQLEDLLDAIYAG